MPIPVLSRSELAKLQSLLRQADAGGRAGVAAPLPPESPPRVYIARVEADPIPAAQESGGVWTPGVLSLPLYRFNDAGSLEEVEDAAGNPVQHDVHNITSQDSPTDAFVLVHQERYTGRFVYSGTSAGNGNGGANAGACCDSLVEGVALTGSPTVCCVGHEQLTVDLGEMGTFMLYHQGGDYWSTYSDDPGEDNPFTYAPSSCDPNSDLYDIVLDAATKQITLEPRDPLNCDPICVRWGLAHDVLSCLGSNQFRLEYSSGVEGITLPTCFCVTPVQGQFVPGEGTCHAFCEDGLPYEWEFTTFTSPNQQAPVECCSNAFCQEVSDLVSNKTFRVRYCGTNPDESVCVWQSPSAIPLQTTCQVGPFCTGAIVDRIYFDVSVAVGSSATVHLALFGLAAGSTYPPCFSAPQMTLWQYQANFEPVINCQQTSFELTFNSYCEHCCVGASFPSTIAIRPINQALPPRTSGHCTNPCEP